MMIENALIPKNADGVLRVISSFRAESRRPIRTSRASRPPSRITRLGCGAFTPAWSKSGESACRPAVGWSIGPRWSWPRR